MPNIRFHDRIKDTTTTTGTGTITVSGTPPSGFQTFSARYAVGDSIYYVISGQSSSEWETGYGTYTASNQISRDKVEQSSNSDNLVNFSAGTKDVFTDIIADRANETPTLSRVCAANLNLATL